MVLGEAKNAVLGMNGKDAANHTRWSIAYAKV